MSQMGHQVSTDMFTMRRYLYQYLSIITRSIIIHRTMNRIAKSVTGIIGKRGEDVLSGNGLGIHFSRGHSMVSIPPDFGLAMDCLPLVHNAHEQINVVHGMYSRKLQQIITGDES